MSLDTPTATAWVFALDDDVPVPYMQRTRDYLLNIDSISPEGPGTTAAGVRRAEGHRADKTGWKRSLKA